jgi:ABC-type transport system substrate-binding protein
MPHEERAARAARLSTAAGIPTLPAPMPAHARSRRLAALLAAPVLLVLGLTGACTKHVAPAGSRTNWVVARVQPAFDPLGPPDAVRWSLERQLTHGLVAEDSSGAIVSAAAERWEVAPDGLTLTFHLTPTLRFTDGAPCQSEDFRRALLAGLNRTDHSTQAWLLGAIRGVEQVRAGKPLGAIGIETPDSLTLVLRLSARDSTLLEKLALPGVGAPWSPASPRSWRRASGLGPYAVVGGDSVKSLLLVRAVPGAGPDSIAVRFLLGAGRALAAMRAGSADLVWPIPGALVGEPLPPGYQFHSSPARPPRRLVLAMRVDLPPTTKLPTRRALAHALNRAELMDELGRAGREHPEWIPGAGPFAFPTLDVDLVREWMELAHLGRSFHVTMVFDADGVAAGLARLLQGEWARLGIYLELRPLRGASLTSELLAGGAHLALVESQAAIDSPPAELAPIVLPLRGPPIGTWRTGWRTREFDPWIATRPAGRAGLVPPAFDAAEASRRLEEELVALPIAELPWLWIEREGAASARFHPHFGPDCSAGVTRPPAAR